MIGTEYSLALAQIDLKHTVPWDDLAGFAIGKGRVVEDEDRASAKRLEKKDEQRNAEHRDYSQGRRHAVGPRDAYRYHRPEQQHGRQRFASIEADRYGTVLRQRSPKKA
jgi:hypothetical protein